MRRFLILFGALALFAPQAFAAHESYPQKDIHIEIVGDDGRLFPLHNLHRAGKSTYRAYLEAVYGKNYGIRVRNGTGGRIGLVIAVDGRNIISGQQSHLAPSERMYILGPYEQASYDGWRTSNQKIHRFYFTDAGDSYAGAWDDYSAMGVITVAVFPEKQHIRPMPQITERKSRRHRRFDAPAEAAESRADESLPGTGFGNEQYSHALIVQFDPVATPSSTYLFKYEWRQTLCDKGILYCGQHRHNRFWPEQERSFGFAPHPGD